MNKAYKEINQIKRKPFFKIQKLYLIKQLKLFQFKKIFEQEKIENNNL